MPTENCDTSVVPGVVAATRERHAVDRRVIVTRCTDLNISSMAHDD
jgi:hypothetical protein